MLLHLDFAGRATIEYYEGSVDEPTFTKQIRWGGNNNP